MEQIRFSPPKLSMKARIFGSIFGDETRTKTLFQIKTPLTRNKRQQLNPNRNNQTSDITIFKDICKI